jgi:peptidoglycan/xylan/chitin deacetylase (PgdA/CDA1 family)
VDLLRRAAPAARTAVKAAAAAGDLVTGPGAGVTVLIYHRVGAGCGGEMDLDPAVFDDQLAWLAATQRVLSLDQAADELTDATGPARPGVVVTFDDGTDDWVDHVLPAIERHRVPATFYVATDFVDRGVPFPGGGRPATWSALRELAASPLTTVGSHTHRHLLLDRLPAADIDDELDRSADLLGEHLGVTPTHFAYPKAVAGSPAAEAAVRRRFRTAVLAGTRANRPGADLHRLQRSPIQRSDGPRWFRRKAQGGMRLEDDLRRTANRLRYRGATR